MGADWLYALCAVQIEPAYHDTSVYCDHTSRATVISSCTSNAMHVTCLRMSAVLGCSMLQACHYSTQVQGDAPEIVLCIIVASVSTLSVVLAAQSGP